MEQFIGCDAHKKFSVFVAVNEKGQAGEGMRVAHDRDVYWKFLVRLPAHSAIAVEASGSYSWLVDEMERSGHHPRLCNPLEAKRRMGLTNKTDKLDARGLAILLRNGTFPEVWIPPGELHDQRELLRLRIFLVRLRTRVKNRIHGTLARYNIQVPGADLFGVQARLELGAWRIGGVREAPLLGALHNASLLPAKAMFLTDTVEGISAARSAGVHPF